MKIKILYGLLVASLFSCLFSACTHVKAQDKVIEITQPSDIQLSATDVPTLTSATIVKAPLILSASPADSLPIQVQLNFTAPEKSTSFWDWIKTNWAAFVLLLLGLGEAFTRLTPSTSDNTVLSVIRRLFDLIIPNLKAGGGRL